MRRPCVRFTIRRMLAVVVTVGVVLSVAARRERFKALADYHEAMHYKHAIALVDKEYDETVFAPTPRCIWHMDVAKKYDRAAARPGFVSGQTRLSRNESRRVGAARRWEDHGRQRFTAAALTTLRNVEEH